MFFPAFPHADLQILHGIMHEVSTFFSNFVSIFFRCGDRFVQDDASLEEKNVKL